MWYLIYPCKNHDQSGLTWVLFAVAIMVKSPRNSLFMGVPGAFFRRVKYSTNLQRILDYILIKETAVYRLSCLFTTVSSFVYSYSIFSLVCFYFFFTIHRFLKNEIP